MKANRRNNTKALELLRATETHELGCVWPYTLPLCPVLVRGEVYLAAVRSREAEVEFRGILDRPFIVQNAVTAPIARVSLPRALVMSGDRAGGRAASIGSNDPENRAGIAFPCPNP